MMPALTIKHEEAHRLASEIARLTGRSITDTVLEALRDKRRTLERPDTEQAEVLLAYGRRFKAQLGDNKAASRQDELYDEVGLPK